MDERLLYGIFTVLLLTLPDASGDVSECPHRVVPESWDRDRSTLNYDDIHVFVFGGPKGLRLKGTCDNAIAKWKDDVNLHSKCEIVGLKYFNTEGSLVDVTTHNGFYFNRDKTGARASLTFLKAELDQLAEAQSFYYAKTFYVDIDNCGTRDKTGCLLFRIEEADDGLECENDGEGDEDGDDGSDEDGDDGNDEDGDGGSDKDGDDGNDEDGDDGNDEDGDDGSDGSDEDGDDGSDEDRDDGSDGSDEDGDDGSDEDRDDGSDGSDEDGDDGSDVVSPTSVPVIPGATNDQVVADEPTDSVSGAAVGLPLALTALFAGIILAVLVIAALLIRHIRKPKKPSLPQSQNPSIDSHSGLDNPAYGDVSLRNPPNPSMDNPTYGSAPAPPNPSLENPIYEMPDADNDPIYDSIGTQLEDPDELYQTL